MKEFSKLSMELIEPSNDSLLIWAEHSSEFFCLSVRLSLHLPVCLSVKFWHFHLVFQKHWANFSLTQSILGRRGFKRLQIKIEAFSQAEIMAYFNTRPFILFINVSQISNGALRSLFSFVKQLKKKSFEFCMFVCLFVWSFFVPVENFSPIWRQHHQRWRAANFDLCSALLASEQWGFVGVAHLLWHGASVYNAHLRGHVTLIPYAGRLAVDVSLLY